MVLSSEKQQLNAIKDQAIRRLSVVDLDLNGFSVSSEENFVKIGYNATKNKVLFWLNLSLGDVVRSTQASPLVQMLGKSLTPENQSRFETDIRNAFEDNFSPENIHLSSLNIEPNPYERTWFMSMVVLDNITDSLIPITLEVSQ